MKRLFALCMLLICSSQNYAFLRGRSFLSPRSQTDHAERELVGWQEDINLCADGAYGSFYIMPIYTHSTKPDELAGYFFGGQEFVVAGTQVEDRPDDALLADYFGLPFDFTSTICVKPIIENIILDFNLYMGLDCWYPGLYVRAHAPWVYASWNMQLCENVQNYGSMPYPPGYMASAEITRNDMARDFTEWMYGFSTPIGDLQPLKFGKIAGARTRTGFSDIQFVFGWNFINDPNYHYGLNVRTSLPTGNTSRALFLFEPMIGNGGHWEFGFGMTGHAIVWHDQDGNPTWGLYGDLNLTHLFPSLQRRSFDFKQNGPSSRYMLIEEIGTPVVQGLLVDGIVAQQQYHSVLMPAINQTTLNAEVAIAVQVDAVIKLCYMHRCFTIEGGYDFWARTSEQIVCRDDFASSMYAIKGDAQVYGFNRENQRFVALNVTQSSATIFGGQGDGNANFLNSNADNSLDDAGNPIIATFEFAPGNDELTLNPPVASDMRGSDQAILLTDNDIDNLSAASPAALSHSFFCAWTVYGIMR